MPRGDGTGPMGLGPMTGRAAGYCAGYSVPGYMNPAVGAGFGAGRGFYGRGGGFGRGGGRGRRNWYYATGLPGWQRAAIGMPAFGGWANPAMYLAPVDVTPKQEADALKYQADMLKQQLEDIQSRIETLEKAQQEDEKKA
ncbi:MAG: hypothetical protein DRP74_02005 [Candidatus Omnitrophota bacterium]|nr:MAG: hypothetical protein DRP74_02005 [Candidatus Omnitrophota bacterium]